MSRTIETVTVGGYRMEVTFDYDGPERGERERGTGLALSPDLPESFEIENINLEDPDDLLRMIEEEALPTLDEVIEAIKKARE